MREFLSGTGVVLTYIILAAGIMLTARKLLTIPDELFRKILHFILLGAYIPFLFAFETWWIAASLAFILILVIYPALMLAEHIPGFSAFVNERKHGEYKYSMVLALGTMVTSICVCWGLFHDRWLVLACVYAWGVGDAFAALVGKRFGRHKLRIPFADPCKSVEGTAAMFVASAISVFTVLMLRGGMGVGGCAVTAAAAAAVSAFVELCTRGGYDTFTCPAAAMLVVLPLSHLLGG